MAKRTALVATPSKLRALGYVRVSTERQAGEGVSLDAQAAKIRAMAEVQDARCSRWSRTREPPGRACSVPGSRGSSEAVDAGAIDVVIVAKLGSADAVGPGLGRTARSVRSP